MCCLRWPISWTPASEAPYLRDLNNSPFSLFTFRRSDTTRRAGARALNFNVRYRPKI